MGRQAKDAAVQNDVGGFGVHHMPILAGTSRLFDRAMLMSIKQQAQLADDFWLREFSSGFDGEENFPRF
jgi:hypothetical protein